MAIKVIQIWEDSKGNLHRTKEAAEKAEAQHADNEEILKVMAALKKHTSSMPKTTKEAAKIARAAYPDLKKIFG